MTRAARRRKPRRSPRRRAVHRRRRIVAVLGVAALAGFVATLVLPNVDRAVKEVTLPLRHEDIIRQQAREKELDPTLIAAVIYAESRFRDQTSHAGARGLMQVTPDTARDIAKRSGGVQFVEADLATPQVNISYGSYHLRFLIDHYGGNEDLALAAYNAGQGNVDRWLGRMGAEFSVDQIPFPETRHYVRNVQQAREDYRRNYADELGL
jgi:soluble lytic murein transglycosylase